FSVNPLQPPTLYEESQFDLVYAFSVFTHLTSETQRGWLREFSRIIAPDKYLMISVHGDFHAKLLPPELYDVYVRDGYAVTSESAEGENICASYQNREYCEELFSKDFQVLDYLPSALTSCGKQDLYLLKKKEFLG
ncbi:MAG TPA: class I SAM-dependent methyltransferase, partial [Pyrinomonadaceae bacterium]|nr:class I SAM-dependent methyltransferase [Pyrinomonadaceae bacterium]